MHEVVQQLYLALKKRALQHKYLARDGGKIIVERGGLIGISSEESSSDNPFIEPEVVVLVTLSYTPIRRAPS